MLIVPALAQNSAYLTCPGEASMDATLPLTSLRRDSGIYKLPGSNILSFSANLYVPLDCTLFTGLVVPLMPLIDELLAFGLVTKSLMSFAMEFDEQLSRGILDELVFISIYAHCFDFTLQSLLWYPLVLPAAALLGIFLLLCSRVPA
jgi:hypothetical protein